MTEGRLRSRMPGATVQPRCASSGRTSRMARVMVERSPGPASQHAMRGAMAQIHQGGQQPVDEDEPVLRTGSHSSPPRPSREQCLMLPVQQRAYFSDEFIRSHSATAQ